jgi:hypothetical protein
MAVLFYYSNEPGPAATPPKHWPDSTRLHRESGLPTLLMFAHPHCPCTRASLGELAKIMRSCQGRVTSHVLMVLPQGMPEGWEKTDLWESAAAIPGVAVDCDFAGTEAKRFGAGTSGAVLLYNTTGELMFDGGITGARGHAGDNAGRSTIVSLLSEGRADRHRTFVFGCPLFDPTSQQPACGESEAPTCHR